MPLVPAKCPECGGNINIDGSKKAAICEFCKQPFVVQDAINNFNTTYNITNNNEIKADVVNVYESKQGDFVIEGGILKKYTGEAVEVVVPDNVLIVDKSAFADLCIVSVELPDSVIEIRPFAFGNCKFLKKVVLSKNIKHMAPDAFMGCTIIEEIEFPESLKNVDPSRFYKGIFKKARIPKVRSDLLHAFFYEGCYEIIAEEAGKMVVERRARGWDDIEIEGMRFNKEKTEIKKYTGSAQKVIVPEGVYSIEHKAFANCANLKSIGFPSSLTSIGNSAFANCENLQFVEIRSTNLAVDRTVFLNCKKIKTVKGISAIKDRNNSINVSQFLLVKEVFKDTPFFRDYCKEHSICPECGEYLSLFGKCKTSGSGYDQNGRRRTMCKNYRKKVF